MSEIYATRPNKNIATFRNCIVSLHVKRMHDRRPPNASVSPSTLRPSAARRPATRDYDRPNENKKYSLAFKLN